MRQLRGEDARFVYGESGHANSNITLISIYDPSTAKEGRVRFKGLLKHIESRLHLSPIFRQKLLRVPARTRLPVLDRGRELRPRVPRPPHRAAEARRLAPVLHPGLAHPRAAARPVEAAVGAVPGRGPRLVPGPAQGQLRDAREDPPRRDRRARRRRDHHAAARHDAGPAGAGAAGALVPRVAARGRSSLLSRALINNVVRPLMFAGPLARSLGKITPAVLGSLGDLWFGKQHMPITRFNSEVSPHRVFESRRFSIEEFKRIRALVPGSTINDAVLAVCGGALRRYLAAHEELPSGSLVSLAPFSVRSSVADDGAGHELSMIRAAARHRHRGPGQAPALDPPPHLGREPRSSRRSAPRSSPTSASMHRRRRSRCRRGCWRVRRSTPASASRSVAARS